MYHPAWKLIDGSDDISDAQSGAFGCAIGVQCCDLHLVVDGLKRNSEEAVAIGANTSALAQKRSVRLFFLARHCCSAQRAARVVPQLLYKAVFAYGMHARVEVYHFYDSVTNRAFVEFLHLLRIATNSL